MVRTTKYQLPITGQARLQSGLGRVREVYRESADMLLMAEVVKVNFIYNTVDVVTVKNKERLVQTNNTQGKFSARLPVNFGGSLSNGMTYGQVIPVNVGDNVLIGFMENDKNSPIVLGIYKASNVSSELAPTGRVAGNPENPELFKDVFSHFTLFPSQTYLSVDGQGSIEATFPGKSFLKIGTGLVGAGRLNDHTFRYTELSKWRLRGRDVYPLNTDIPQILFQHTGGTEGLMTNVLFDDDGTFTVSKTNANDNNRTDVQLIDNENFKVRYQEDAQKKNDAKATDWSELGIKDGTPFMQNKKHSAFLDKEKGLLIDGVPINDLISGGGSDVSQAISDIQADIDDLKSRIADMSGKEFDELRKQLNELQDYIEKNITPFLDDLDGMQININQLQDQMQTNQASVDTITKWLSDAQGDDPSLAVRLERMEAVSNSIKSITDEVIRARTDTNTKFSYMTLGARIDALTSDVIKLKTLTADYLDIRNNYEQMVTRVSKFEDNLDNLKEKLDFFLTSEFRDESKQYVATIEPSGTTEFRNGVGSTDLVARIYRFGFDWTDMIRDEGFIWTRSSYDGAGDREWNEAHKAGTKKLTVTADDFKYSASFTVNVVVDGNIIESEEA